MKSKVVTMFSIVAVGMVSASSIQHADEYFDNLILSAQNITGSPFTPDGVPVPDFNITIASTRITNRKFKAAFMYGKITGWMDLTRDGHCDPTHWLHGNVTFSCSVNLSSVYGAYAVTATGHTLSGRETLMDVFVRIREGKAKFVATSFPNRAPRITMDIIKPLKMRSELLPDPELNSERQKEFTTQLQKHTNEDIERILSVDVSEALTDIAKNTLLPNV